MKWLVFLSFVCGLAQAQGPASYEGADRQERLVAGAKALALQLAPDHKCTRPSP